MVISLIGTRSPASSVQSPAARMGPDARRDLSVKALARTEPISRLAERLDVSRRFVYRQKHKAAEALDEAFAPSVREDDVLFELPVTKAWIRQLVLSAVLHGHAPFRGVQSMTEDLLDRPIALGTVHNILQDAVDKARAIHANEDLSRIRTGAHDEIYQAGTPVLAGVDVDSTYCYLLHAAESCDEETWGLALLEASERGLLPDRTIGDGGNALRAGQTAAWGEAIPCDGDVFHAEMDLGKVAYYLSNRAKGCVSARERLERKMARAKARGKGNPLSKKLALARAAEAKAVALARDVRTLSGWLTRDILAAAGPDLSTRRELFDFLVKELRHLEPQAAHRIRPVRKMLENSRDRLLAFAGLLDERIEEIAARFGVPAFLVHAVCETEGIDERSPARWPREAALRNKLRYRFHDVRSAVREALAETHRASSLVENYNSRLRSYFFLRRHVGNDYLELLRFFLNHRRYRRSEKPERVGKSPAELLHGTDHPHWLELLDFTRFRRNAA